jgi:hypothetical protein
MSVTRLLCEKCGVPLAYCKCGVQMTTGSITQLTTGNAAQSFLPRICYWKRDGDGNYYVRCRDFRVESPAQMDSDQFTLHGYSHCPFCGGKLVVT